MIEYINTWKICACGEICAREKQTCSYATYVHAKSDVCVLRMHTCRHESSTRPPEYVLSPYMNQRCHRVRMRGVPVMAVPYVICVVSLYWLSHMSYVTCMYDMSVHGGEEA